MHTHEFAFQNGDRVVDTITGVAGTIVGRLNYLFGCNRYMVQPSSADNKQPEPFYVDEGQLELVDVPKLEVKTSPNMGGWKPDPVR